MRILWKDNPSRQEKQQEAQRWILQAKHDLAAGKFLADRGHHATACFCSQQVAEKAIKAVLYARGAKKVDVDSLVELGQILHQKASGVADLPEDIVKLDPYYESARYPSAWPSGTPSQNLSSAESKEALKVANEVLQFAETAIHRLLSE